MIQIQCPSCQTHYRVDERVLPDRNPTFKCSRCGHTFTTRVPLEPKGAAPPPTARHREYEAQPAAAKGTPPPGSQPAVGKGGASPPLAFNIAKSGDKPRPVAPQPGGPVGGLQRPFNEPEPASGSDETFAFDFHDEDVEPMDITNLARDAELSEEWQVGEPEATPSAAKQDKPSEGISAPFEATPAFERRHAAEPVFAREIERPIGVDQVRVRSAGFFLEMIVAMLVAFAALSLIIVSAPQASLEFLRSIPALGERLAPAGNASRSVSLQDVHAEYRRLRNGETALLVAGRAQNSSGGPLHVIRIGVSLLDADQREVARRSIYCGNVISNKAIAEMTPREIEFFQRLEPQKGFAVKSGESSAFVVVFLNPPSQPSKFRVQVAAAQPLEASTAAGT